DRTLAFEADNLDDAVSAFLEEPDNIAVADGLIWRDDTQLLGAKEVQCPAAGVGSHGDREARMLLQAFLERERGLVAVPEGLGRDSEDDPVRLAGHDRIDGLNLRGLDELYEAIEVIVVVERDIRDGDPADVVGDPGDPHRVEFRLHTGVRRRDEHSDLGPPTETVSHVSSRPENEIFVRHAADERADRDAVATGPGDTACNLVGVPGVE